jgi:guanylate kinase
LQQKKSRGSLFIVSAPSGTGKTTLCRKAVSSLPNLSFSVSYTTRLPRKGEVNDRDYTFITRQEFSRMADRGEFLEWAEVHGELYGTSHKRVGKLMDAGNDVLLDIDTQGAQQIKEKEPEGTYIFILPPSLETLKERLQNRMTDSPEKIEKRLRKAIEEIKTFRIYDYVILNDRLESALKEFEAVILSQRVRTKTVNPLWIQERFFLNQEEK